MESESGHHSLSLLSCSVDGFRSIDYISSTPTSRKGFEQIHDLASRTVKGILKLRGPAVGSLAIAARVDIAWQMIGGIKRFFVIEAAPWPQCAVLSDTPGVYGKLAKELLWQLTQAQVEPSIGHLV